MIIERIKSEGLAHLSYILGSNNEAIVIDPRRDVQVYLDLAQQKEMHIEYIFETHRNEDYVIGSLELADLTGARIFHGPELDYKFGESLIDGQEFFFGVLKLTALHTPGHTNGCMSYVLTDLASGEAPVMVFTGDALFIGDVGRTDFGGPDEAPRMAANLYNSIFNKLLPLGDSVILCPAHGSGSVCGAGISKREHSTLGLERLQNPVLQLKKIEDFIQHKVTEHHEYAPYFRKMEEYNQNGPPLLGHLPSPIPLSPQKFQDWMKQGAIVVDTRMPADFGSAYIKGSYNIMVQNLPTYAGWVLPYNKPILLVVEDPAHLDSAVRYLIRIGYDQIVGYLYRGVEAWYNKALPIEHLGLITYEGLKNQIDQGDNLVLLDVRRKDEWEEGHLEGVVHTYVGHLPKQQVEIPKDRPIVVICASGERASLGASILRRQGYLDVYNLLGGMLSWKNADYPTVK